MRLLHLLPGGSVTKGSSILRSGLGNGTGDNLNEKPLCHPQDYGANEHRRFAELWALRPHEAAESYGKTEYRFHYGAMDGRLVAE